jgi:hypothetical protein
MKRHLKDMLSGFDSTLSLPRLWMAVFGLATLIAGAIVLAHLLQIKDPAALSAWRDILTTAAPWTLSICSLPFAVSKVTGSLEGIVASLSGRKREG